MINPRIVESSGEQTGKKDVLVYQVNPVLLPSELCKSSST